jgi:hypothetical protein
MLQLVLAENQCDERSKRGSKSAALSADKRHKTWNLQWDLMAGIYPQFEVKFIGFELEEWFKYINLVKSLYKYILYT